MEHDDNVFLFTVAETRRPFGLGGGLPGVGLETWVWSGTDGWEFRGRGIPTDHRVLEVVATSTGWLAAGMQVGRAAPMAWSSADGETWEPVELPGPDEQDIWMMAAHAEHETMVIVATAAERSSDRLWRAIQHTYGDLARYPLIGAMGFDTQILVTGPRASHSPWSSLKSSVSPWMISPPEVQVHLCR